MKSYVTSTVKCTHIYLFASMCRINVDDIYLYGTMLELNRSQNVYRMIIYRALYSSSWGEFVAMRAE